MIKVGSNQQLSGVSQSQCCSSPGQTPLHLAVLTGNQALVKALLAFGVNPDVQEVRCGKTGLFLAVEAGHQAIAEVLLCYGASLTTSTYSGATPASLASEHNRN